jgi:hypothetical protein
MSTNTLSLISDTVKNSGNTMASISFDSATLHQDAERLMRKSLRRITRLVLLLVALALASWANLL